MNSYLSSGHKKGWNPCQGTQPLNGYAIFEPSRKAGGLQALNPPFA